MSDQLALSRERWETLEPVLDAALALAGDARERFLNQACGSDSTMRRELDEFLAACERPGSADHLLARPAAQRFSSLWNEPDAAAQLAAALDGRYTVEGETGRGGMAVVYRVRDVRHGRPV